MNLNSESLSGDEDGIGAGTPSLNIHINVRILSLDTFKVHKLSLVTPGLELMTRQSEWYINVLSRNIFADRPVIKTPESRNGQRGKEDYFVFVPEKAVPFVVP
ncbi:hypothetical protein TNCV_3542701 [Trichonephila clavipes]|nr:hypothetical protein TNCV_3542701 [Trichonephila clavipes]